jgi:hypothetical protein
MAAEAEIWSPPECQLGTQVYYYRDPLNLEGPSLGFICRKPGAVTVSVMVFSPSGGLVEKMSVRHKDDPGLRENDAWRQWGCWDFSDLEKNIRKILPLSASLMAQHERSKKQQ